MAMITRLRVNEAMQIGEDVLSLVEVAKGQNVVDHAVAADAMKIQRRAMPFRLDIGGGYISVSALGPKQGANVYAAIPRTTPIRKVRKEQS